MSGARVCVSKFWRFTQKCEFISRNSVFTSHISDFSLRILSLHFTFLLTILIFFFLLIFFSPQLSFFLGNSEFTSHNSVFFIWVLKFFFLYLLIKKFTGREKKPELRHKSELRATKSELRKKSELWDKKLQLPFYLCSYVFIYFFIPRWKQASRCFRPLHFCVFCFSPAKKGLFFFLSDNIVCNSFT